MTTGHGHNIDFRIMGVVDGKGRCVTGKWMDPEAGGYYAGFQLTQRPPPERLAWTCQPATARVASRGHMSTVRRVQALIAGGIAQSKSSASRPLQAASEAARRRLLSIGEPSPQTRGRQAAVIYRHALAATVASAWLRAGLHSRSIT